MRVAPGLDGPDEDEDSVLAWRDDNGVGVSRLKSNDRELLSRKVLPRVSHAVSLRRPTLCSKSFAVGIHIS